MDEREAGDAVPIMDGDQDVHPLTEIHENTKSTQRLT